MSKTLHRSPKTGQFVLGRGSAEKISAVEGLVRTDRTSSLLAASDARNETGEALRNRIKAEFRK